MPKKKDKKKGKDSLPDLGKEIVDEVARAVQRVRESIEERKVLDDLKGIRNEVENLARRVAALERPGSGGTTAASGAAATRSTASRSTASRSTSSRSTAAKPRASRSTAAKKPAASRSTAAKKPAAKKPAASRSTAAKKPAASRSRTTRSRSSS
jgi:cell division septation protein DedD